MRRAKTKGLEYINALTSCDKIKLLAPVQI